MQHLQAAIMEESLINLDGSQYFVVYDYSLMSGCTLADVTYDVTLRSVFTIDGIPTHLTSEEMNRVVGKITEQLKEKEGVI